MGEPWKEVFFCHLGIYNRNWQFEIIWIFTKMCQVGFSRQFEERFACSL